MSQLLIAIALWLDSSAIEAWSVATAEGLDRTSDRGAYDLCLDRAIIGQLTEKPIGPDGHVYTGYSLVTPLAVSFDDHGNRAATACAVVLHGGEF